MPRNAKLYRKTSNQVNLILDRKGAEYENLRILQSTFSVDSLQ